LAAIEPENVKPSRRRKIALLALCVDRSNQVRQLHPATASDLFQALPKGIFKGHARAVERNVSLKVSAFCGAG
jgi:hypothetical protein